LIPVGITILTAELVGEPGCAAPDPVPDPATWEPGELTDTTVNGAAELGELTAGVPPLPLAAGSVATLEAAGA
jgi:hypothetical protein